MSYCGCGSNRINLEAQTDSETQICPDCTMMVTVPNLVLRLARTIHGIESPPSPVALLPQRGQDPVLPLRSYNPTTAPPGLPGADHITRPGPAVGVSATPHVPPNGWTPLHLGSSAPAALIPPGEGRWFEARAPFSCQVKRLEPKVGGLLIVEFVTGSERWDAERCAPEDWRPPSELRPLMPGQVIGFVVEHTSDIPQSFLATLWVEPEK